MENAKTIILENGALKFTAHALGAGPLILCLHGFPDNARSFRFQLPALAAAGYRAVAVTLRGYEPGSQAVPTDYSLDALAGDVFSFLDCLGTQTAHLVGHDWGAAIGYQACALAPQRFRSLTAMAVPHTGRFLNDAIKNPRQLALSWYMFFFQLRGVADHVVQRNDFQFIRKLWRDWSPGWDCPEEILQDVLSTFRQPGVKKAALAYYRTALAPRSLTPSARKANRYQVPVPTLALTGERDGCIDSQVFRQLMREEDFPGGLEVKLLAEAGHFLHMEQPDAVNKLLLNWLPQWDRNR